MNTPWRPALLALVALPATAAATEPTPEPAPLPTQPLARALYENDSQPNYLTAADDNTFKVYFKDNIRFETSNKMFTAKIGGRIMHDWSFFSEDIEKNGGPDFENGTEFRRVRLYLAGTLYKSFDYKIQFEFANAEDSNVSDDGDPTNDDNGNERPNFKDVYMGYKYSKQANFRVGQFYEPAGIEEQTSSNYISFLERPAASGITPGRNPGAMFFGRTDDERVTYAVGVFKDDNDDNGDSKNGSGQWAFTGRVTGLPMLKEDGDLVHVGGWYSQRDSGGTFDEDFRPPAHLAPKLISNSAFAADDVSQYGVEVAGIFDSFWALGEFLSTDVDAEDGGPNADVSGYAVSAGYYLTGERRGYKKSTATFDKTKVKRPFGQEGGWGAWEVAARYGMVEFENIRGGAVGDDDELTDITLGVNWYLNTNVRIMFNYVDFDIDSDKLALDEDGTAFLVRFHLWL